LLRVVLAMLSARRDEVETEVSAVGGADEALDVAGAVLLCELCELLWVDRFLDVLLGVAVVLRLVLKGVPRIALVDWFRRVALGGAGPIVKLELAPMASSRLLWW
jgi:hypothetical protein